jgi:hypothetical protein
VYDRKENAIFEYTIYNDDFLNRREIYMNWTLVNNEIVTLQSLEACRLVESYEKGELKGRLKEIATTLDDESNPVKPVKHRK